MQRSLVEHLNGNFNKVFTGIAVATLFILSACSQSSKPVKDTVKSYSSSPLISYVDPFIGTAGKGKTYPGATQPYGMVQLSPDNGRNGWDWISGYFYPDNIIAGLVIPIFLAQVLVTYTTFRLCR